MNVRITGPQVPQIPAVQGRRKFIKVSKEYQIPVKRITGTFSLEQFAGSEGYLRLLDFIQTLNESVIDKKLTDNCYESESVQRIIGLLNQLDDWISEFPPQEAGSRFGNLSFRKWFEKLENEAAILHQSIHTDASVELVPYFLGSFGDKTRIDYGSGHELSFVGWLCCLELLDYFDQRDYQAIVTRIFNRYICLVRKIQRVYNLEPAGSHGVWGLDDYQFLPYFWGSAQLLSHKKIKPKSISDPDIVQYFAKDYLYLSCIDYINQNKRGPFHEHSPLLNDISGVPNWQKVNTGMLKMYLAEVLGKFPVVQHFLFGSLLPFEPADEIQPQ